MAEPLKNMFNRSFIQDVITAFQAVHADFDGTAFLNFIFDEQWEARELKDRMRHIAKALHQVLPGDYHTALAVVRQAAASPVLAKYGFETMIFPDFVEFYGLNDPAISIPALEQFTQQCSAEYAIRPFILRDVTGVMAQMLAWTQHSSPHVRRLASEGCRPRLPWAMALPTFKADPAAILPILEALKQDESEYVRRSVANNLNDIAKDNPQMVMDVLARWNSINDDGVRWILRHALRSLVKRGHAEALNLLGYSGEVAFVVKNLTVEPAVVSVGGEVMVSFLIELHSEQPQNLMIDYIVHHQKANGRQTPKTFKLTKCVLPPGAALTLTKKHSLRPITTRRYYPGEHAVEIQVNGKLSGRQTFTLLDTP